MNKLTAFWQDTANLVLGIWLAVSPWILLYAGQTAPAWNAHIVGVVIAVMAGAALLAFQRWEEWVNAALAAWLILSPWILGYSGLQTVVWNQAVVGLLVGALALWSAATDHDTGGLATKS
jgi:SPW repeat